jgi:hypothetical protein
MEKVVPEFLIPELNNPSGSSVRPEVTLWPEPFQVHFTVSPGWTVTLAGEKISFPLGPTSTLTVAAGTACVARIRQDSIPAESRSFLRVIFATVHERKSLAAEFRMETCFFIGVFLLGRRRHVGLFNCSRRQCSTAENPAEGYGYCAWRDASFDKIASGSAPNVLRTPFANTGAPGPGSCGRPQLQAIS